VGKRIRMSNKYRKRSNWFLNVGDVDIHGADVNQVVASNSDQNSAKFPNQLFPVSILHRHFHICG
jgi:hypothetical protein